MKVRANRSTVATLVGMLAVPACLLLQPLDDAREQGQAGNAGVSGDAGAGVGASNTGGTSGSNEGGTGGKAGSNAGGEGTAGDMSAGEAGAGGAGMGSGGTSSGGTSGGNGCELATGTCRANAPTGWRGPALMNANCGPTPSLRAGTGFAANQPACSYTALADDCSGAVTVRFHNNTACTSQVSMYATQSPGECDLTPPISNTGTHYLVNGLKVAPCTTATPPAAPTYVNPATFCEQSGVCSGGETCTPPGSGQICIWTTTNPNQCPAPYTIGPTTLVVGAPVCPASAPAMGSCQARMRLGSQQNCSSTVADLILDPALGCRSVGSPGPIGAAIVEVVAPNGCQAAPSTAMRTGDAYVCCLPAN